MVIYVSFVDAGDCKTAFHSFVTWWLSAQDWQQPTRRYTLCVCVEPAPMICCVILLMFVFVIFLCFAHFNVLLTLQLLHKFVLFLSSINQGHRHVVKSMVGWGAHSFDSCGQHWIFFFKWGVLWHMHQSQSMAM